MIKIEALRWFKETFGGELQAAVAGTPFSIDLLVAIAAQETGTFWARNRNKLTRDELLELCVGDTLDENKGRKAFPRTKEHLLERPRGDEMFAIGHEALVAMAKHDPGYAAAANNPRKFCHGYGVFQYDLQFFLVDSDYFLERRWRTFRGTLGKCLDELNAAAKRIGLDDGHKLSDNESVAVAIAYNSGRFIPSKGFKQGHKADDGRFYGENVNDYLRMSKTIDTPLAVAEVPAPPPGVAAVPPPTPVSPGGDIFSVDVNTAALNVRREPKIDRDRPNSNVIATLPAGHRVRRVSGSKTDKFLEIETSLNGALIRGFSSTKFLVREAGAAPVVVDTPAPTPPTSGVVAVFAPPKPGQVIRRTAAANALSLNEPNQPGRSGTTPEELREELWAIVDYLAVDKASHVRYQPTDKTFCNIYAHDFCMLAGVYLPRCWWTDDAIERLTRGENVTPRVEATISEQRANDIFGWLKSFGLRFGWRQTGTLTKLQNEANLGAVGLVIAKNKSDGAPGHIAMVVPERDALKARRDTTTGEVTVPLQSQAGRTNFRFGTSSGTWWQAEKFADSAFWVHA
jgi:hypothetical protein